MNQQTETKQPWEMTAEEFRTSHSWDYAGKRGWEGVGKELVGATPWRQVHAKRIARALRDNKPVPASVLKDYPDLVIRRQTK